eukprot:GHVS01030135.1.p1 GENE.GHVS01030135.1~~GHVS01030135.1.p1  ORF type:complete len:206 (-),score=38.68 GHVS01030135.1:189-737(-)
MQPVVLLRGTQRGGFFPLPSSISSPVFRHWAPSAAFCSVASCRPITSLSRCHLLSAPTHPPVVFHQRLSVRFLGNAYMGSPKPFDLPAHVSLLRQSVGGPPPLLYLEFKAKCESLRIVLFTAVTSLLLLDLALRPLRSSYWSSLARLKSLPPASRPNQDSQQAIIAEAPLESVAAYRRITNK